MPADKRVAPPPAKRSATSTRAPFDRASIAALAPAAPKPAIRTSVSSSKEPTPVSGVRSLNTALEPTDAVRYAQRPFDGLVHRRPGLRHRPADRALDPAFGAARPPLHEGALRPLRRRRSGREREARLVSHGAAGDAGLLDLLRERPAPRRAGAADPRGDLDGPLHQPDRREDQRHRLGAVRAS